MASASDLLIASHRAAQARFPTAKAARPVLIAGYSVATKARGAEGFALRPALAAQTAADPLCLNRCDWSARALRRRGAESKDLDRFREVGLGRIAGKPAPMLDLHELTARVTVRQPLPVAETRQINSLDSSLMIEWECGERTVAQPGSCGCAAANAATISKSVSNAKEDAQCDLALSNRLLVIGLAAAAYIGPVHAATIYTGDIIQDKASALARVSGRFREDSPFAIYRDLSVPEACASGTASGSRRVP